VPAAACFRLGFLPGPSVWIGAPRRALTIQDLAALGRRWFDEVWNRRRTETIDELMQPPAGTASLTS